MNWALMLTMISTMAQAEPLVVPSGQDITYHDTIQNQPGPAGLTYRFRFVAPAIARDTGAVSIDQAAGDMDHLCAQFALPRLPVGGPAPSQIVISLSDRPVEFAVPTPEATQFFQAYLIEDGQCIWEAF